MRLRELRHKKWFQFVSNKYILILLVFLVWMVFFDTNNWFIHKELDDEINGLESNKDFYSDEISKDKLFLKKMEDSFELEKFARETYFLKKENEDIFIIEHEDSIKNKSRE